MVTLLIICGVLSLCVCSFLFGLKLAERMYTEREVAINYALRKQYARLRAGIDADDTAQPYVSADPADPANKSVVSGAFQARFNEHGRAVERIK